MLTLRAAAALALLACTAMAQTPRPKAAAAPPALQTSLAIVSQFEDGSPLEGHKLVIGEFAFFRFGVRNFRIAEEGKVQLTGTIQVFDPRGVPIAPPDEVAIATSLRQEDKDWQPVFRSQFQLPGIAPPGTYKIHFEANDLQAHQKAAGDIAFEVEGRNVPAGPALAIRGIGFYREAEDETALAVAAYRPGDTVWVRFDATGYKYGEQNAIDVTYDVAVLDSQDKQLFGQTDAAAEKSQGFYPQPWIPGSFSLTLQPTMARGTYAIAITARDAVGKQTVTEKSEFKVE